MDTAVESDSHGGQGVRDVVRAYQGQSGALAHTVHNDIEGRALCPEGLDILGADVGGFAYAVQNDFPRKIATELRDVFVVGVENSGAAGREGRDQFVLGASDAGERIEIFEVNGRDDGDHSDFRLGDFCERRDFAGVRHAHLDNGHLLFRLQLKQHQGKAEMIVEVPLRLQYRVASRQHMGDGFLGSGFAGGARDTDYRLAPQAAHGPGQRLECGERVINGQQAGLYRETRQLIFADHRRDSATFQSLVDEVVTVEALALHREEKLAGLNGAGVNGVSPGHFPEFAFAGGAQKLFDLRQG